MMTQYENMISVFSADYLGELYYFCLKKTGNANEAEDLSSDITLNVITELRKGTIPDSFSAWVWKIARNRYSVWADKKNKKSKRFAGESIEDIEISDENDIESELVHGEDLKFLRRELSFISKDYRDIVIAYYIDDLKVQTIAKMLGIPEGTVMSKLYRARNILKEGMNMAREFGVRSYKPENISFIGSGNFPSSLPNSITNRQIPKNILLQAHNNPSTIEELSVEIGIAAPYMEEEVKILVDGDLLIETNGKFVTNFFIADKECQVEVYTVQRNLSKERSNLIDEIINDKFDEIKMLGIIGDNISDNEFKWLIVTMASDLFFDTISNIFKRKDGGDWGYVGFEQHNLISENIHMWHNGTGNNSAMFHRYSYPGLLNSCNLLDMNYTSFFADIVKNNRNINSFMESEKILWAKIDGWYAHTDENGNIIFDVAIFKNGSYDKMVDIIKSHVKFETLQEKYSALTKEVMEIIKKYSNPVINDTINYYATMFMYDTRRLIINDEVEAGRLIIPENPEKSNIGMYVTVY